MSTNERNAEEIFNAARHEADPRERAGYLDGACGDDTSLRAEVEALLEADAKAGSFFEKAREQLRVEATADVDPTAVRSTPGEQAGDRIGRYKLLQPIGEGGFGSVWMAEQREPVRRQVALKIIKLGMDTKQVVARFEAERQALALMDHPNICKVLDAGSTDRGRPYFVMELVRGVPITEYCDTENLTPKERLELFILVCNAVQHAHQKGIIHRDLKPSNVMVTLHDGKPVPRVIDFGIAKAMDRELTAKTVFTEYRQFIGTPEYMSPEQAEMSGLDIDTRSDIYSLGVLLYELLTGVTPFDPKKLRAAGLNEIRRIIREEEPSKPSTRLSTRGTASDDDRDPTSIDHVARHRSVDAPALLKTLRGDLDWITMKALEKDRTRRYETANGFALDIRRYLDNEPVSASPPSASYRLRKFIRRNRASVTAAGFVFTALILGVIGITYGLLRAREAERLASNDRDEATRQAKIAQAVNHFLHHDLLAAVAPSGELGRGRDAKLIDVLETAALRVERAAGPGGPFHTEPLVESSVRFTIGNAYRQLGEFSAAEPHLERALELHRQELGVEAETTLKLMADLANIYSNQARFREAEALYTTIRKSSPQVIAEDHPIMLSVMFGFAKVYLQTGRRHEAEETFTETIRNQERVLGPDHHATLTTKVSLANLYIEQGRYSEAEALFESVLAVQQRDYGEKHPSTLLTMMNLGAVYAEQTRYREAESHSQHVLKIMEEVYGEKHPRTAVLRVNLASLYTQTNRKAEAEAMLGDALEVLEREPGPEHPDTLNALGVLAGLYSETGRGGKALEIYERILDLQKRVLGETHVKTLFITRRIARSYAHGGRLDEASPLLEWVLETSRREWGENHPTTLDAMNDLADLYRWQGRHNDSERLILKAIEVSKRELGPAHRRTLGTITNLGNLYVSMDRFEDAAAQYEISLPLKRKTFGVRDPWTRIAMRGLAGAYEHLGRQEETLRLRRELLEFRIAEASKPSANAVTLNNMAWDLLTGAAELRDPARALKLAERACQQEEAAGGESLWMYLDTLALAQHRTGDSARAVETQERAIALIPAGTNPSTVAELESNLADFRAARDGAPREDDR